MEIKDIIKSRRNELGLTMAEVAKACDVSEATVSRWESGNIANMRRSKIAALSSILQLPPTLLIDPLRSNETSLDQSIFRFDNIRPIETQKIPLLGKIACGQPVFAEEGFQTFVEASSDIKADFCLQAHGDSMINARIHDGDIVFIRKQPEVENGQIAAVIIEDEATLKRVSYFPEKSMLILKPENPAYEDLVYIGQELEHIRILGKAVAFQSLVK